MGLHFGLKKAIDFHIFERHVFGLVGLTILMKGKPIE